MDLVIKDRTALVAASANGLGLATAIRLAMEGCKVALCDLNEDALENAIGQVQKHALSDSHVRAFQVDLRNTESIAGLVNAVTDELGTVSILVQIPEVIRLVLLILQVMKYGFRLSS